MSRLQLHVAVESVPVAKEEALEGDWRVVRLMKRWRDRAYLTGPAKAPISIVLTTLAATHYQGEVSPSRALSLILDAIVASLPPVGQRLVVLNPTNAIAQR